MGTPLHGDAPPPLVAATPPRLAEHVGALLELDVLTGPPAEDDRPVLVVATAATARTIVDGGLVAALGSRLAGVVCWQLGPAELVHLLDHLEAERIPAFVGVPDRDDLLEALAATERAIRHTEDLQLARLLLRLDERIGAVLDA